MKSQQNIFSRTKIFITETMHKLSEFSYSIRVGGGNMDIVVSSMFSTCDVDRTAMLSTFGNVEFKPHIFFMHCNFSILILFGA